MISIVDEPVQTSAPLSTNGHKYSGWRRRGTFEVLEEDRVALRSCVEPWKFDLRHEESLIGRDRRPRAAAFPTANSPSCDLAAGILALGDQWIMHECLNDCITNDRRKIHLFQETLSFPENAVEEIERDHV